MENKICNNLLKQKDVKRLIEVEKCPKCGYNGHMQAVSKLGSGKKIYICNKCKHHFEK